MQMITCPSCGTDAPAVAHTCKECFHDFDADRSAQPKGSSPLVLLVAIAGIALVVAGAVYTASQRPVDARVLVDDTSQSVKWVTLYEGGRREVDNLLFSDIAKLQHVTTSNGNQQVVAVTLDGDRKIIDANPNASLRNTAETYAELMDKPLEFVDETTGFMSGD